MGGNNNYYNLFLLELKVSQDSTNTYQELSLKKSMDLENKKKQIKELEDIMHSSEKKLDEGLSFFKYRFLLFIINLFYAEEKAFKISLKSKDEEVDRYKLKLKEEREKLSELKAQLSILEEGKRKNKSCYNVVIIQKYIIYLYV